MDKSIKPYWIIQDEIVHELNINGFSTKKQRDSICELRFYESCLYNLPYDNNYPNIRAIFREIREHLK